MANQYVWIGTAVGVFLACISIGYAVFAYSAPTQVFGPQMMQQMQTDLQMMNQMNQ
jgi:hypothetical protein